ncbi:unnamed protein product [Clavelina lepadiformis]|uniref:Uncharacterized protein n=1 Tax=Clavelina lepadiformis TaxID=159417 RepID=A0ABP0G443_CLALP
MQNYGVFGDSDVEDAGRYPLKFLPMSNTGGRNSEASTRKSRFTRENICGQISSSKEPSFTQCSIQSTSAKFRASPKHDTFSGGENLVSVRPKTPPSDPALLRKTERSLVRAKAWVHHSDSQIALKEKSKINTGMAAQTGIMNFRRESAETDVNYRQTFTKVYKQCKASDRISFQHLNKIATAKRKVHQELRKTVKQTKTTSSQLSISDPPDVAAKNSFDAEQRGNKNIVATERTTSVSCPSRKDSSEIELPQVAAKCKRKIICEVLKRVDTDENCSKSLTEDHVELPEGKDRREPSNHFSLTTATHSKFSNENRPTLECKEKFVDEHEMKSFPYFEVSDLSDDLSGKSEETEFNEGKESMPKDSTLFSSETSPAKLVCDKLKLHADVDVSDDKITIKGERKSEGSGPQQDENELGDVTSYTNKACVVSSLTGPTMKSQQRGEEISQIPSSSFEDLDEDWLHFTYTRQRQSQNCETGKDSTSPTKDGVSLKTRTREQRSEPTGTSCKRCACNVFSTLFTILLLLAVLLLIYFQVLGDPYNLAKLLGFASDEKNTTFVTETGYSY